MRCVADRETHILLCTRFLLNRVRQGERLGSIDKTGNRLTSIRNTYIYIYTSPPDRILILSFYNGISHKAMSIWINFLGRDNTKLVVVVVYG